MSAKRCGVWRIQSREAPVRTTLAVEQRCRLRLVDVCKITLILVSLPDPSPTLEGPPGDPRSESEGRSGVFAPRDFEFPEQPGCSNREYLRLEIRSFLNRLGYLRRVTLSSLNGQEVFGRVTLTLKQFVKHKLLKLLKCDEMLLGVSESAQERFVQQIKLLLPLRENTDAVVVKRAKLVGLEMFVFLAFQNTSSRRSPADIALEEQIKAGQTTEADEKTKLFEQLLPLVGAETAFQLAYGSSSTGGGTGSSGRPSLAQIQAADRAEVEEFLRTQFGGFEFFLDKHASKLQVGLTADGLIVAADDPSAVTAKNVLDVIVEQGLTRSWQD